MKHLILEATLDDVPELEFLIALSARELARPYYTAEQIDAALGSAWGVDTQLIRDRTYFVVRQSGVLVACGGWSKRKALFGADALTRGEPELLDPQHDSARIRAFFVHPNWARQGLGKALLERCEAEARSAGFQSAELVATLSGQPLYAAYGYAAQIPKEYSLRDGIHITFVPMRKERL